MLNVKVIVTYTHGRTVVIILLTTFGHVNIGKFTHTLSYNYSKFKSKGTFVYCNPRKRTQKTEKNVKRNTL